MMESLWEPQRPQLFHHAQFNKTRKVGVVVENLWKNNNAASTIERLCELATTTSPSIENPLSLSLDEPQLSYQGSALVTYPINPPTRWPHTT